MYLSFGSSTRAIKILLLRVRTHDRNFVPIIICNKIVAVLKTNVSSCQINDPSPQINIPCCQMNAALSNKFPKFLRQNHDPRDIYLFARGSHICVPFWPCGRALSSYFATVRIKSLGFRAENRPFLSSYKRSVMLRLGCVYMELKRRPCSAPIPEIYFIREQNWSWKQALFKLMSTRPNIKLKTNPFSVKISVDLLNTGPKSELKEGAWIAPCNRGLNME